MILHHFYVEELIGCPFNNVLSTEESEEERKNTHTRDLVTARSSERIKEKKSDEIRNSEGPGFLPVKFVKLLNLFLVLLHLSVHSFLL